MGKKNVYMGLQEYILTQLIEKSRLYDIHLIISSAHR